MSTQKLYQQDSTLRRFNATVLCCFSEKNRYAVELDQTAFYPEGGGQPCDLGALGPARVVGVRLEEDGRIIHYTDAPLCPGKEIEGVIDSARRDDLTCQHSGEHIVSGLIHRRFGFDNVGFHLGSQVVTIDFNGELSKEDLSSIEEQANTYIRQNHPVHIFFPSAAERASLDYRSKKPLDGEVRIVEFPFADTCACCGTHVRQTGEIGLVKLLSVAHFRSGCRIEMLSGGRALAFLSEMFSQNSRISALLSSPLQQTANAAQRLLNEYSSLKEKFAAAEARQFSLLAQQYAGRDNALAFFTDLDPAAVRRLTVAMMEKCSGCCAVFSGSDASGYHFAIGKQGADLRALINQFNHTLNARGGGRDSFFFQGFARSTQQQIRAFWQQYV